MSEPATPRVASTHWDDCEKAHHDCALAKLAAALEAQRWVPFTKRDQKMFDRLVARRDLLQRRIDSSASHKAADENRQEQHALDWALARLCNGLPTAPTPGEEAK